MNTEVNQETEQQSHRHSSRRSRRSHGSRHSRMKIWGLSAALLILVVIFFITIVHNSSRIEKLSDRVSTTQEQLFLKEQELEELKTRLQDAQKELDEYIAGRLPSVMKLEPDQVLTVNRESIKNIVFSVVTQNGVKVYEYKTVVENLTREPVVPRFRVLVFDQYGVQIGIDQVLKGEELAPGESRSYSSEVKLFMKEEPAYFQVTSLIPTKAQYIQSLLEH